MTAKTDGIDWTWNAAAICCSASTSTLARIHRPAYSAASCSNSGDNCLQGSHQVAHRSKMTGTVMDRSMTSVWKLAAVASMISPAGAPSMAASVLRC